MGDSPSNCYMELSESNLSPPTKTRRIQDKLSRTEDNIIVYTLYVSNIPENWSVRDLENYFESFGEVTSIEIGEKLNDERKLGRVFRHGFVTFKEAESATMALNGNGYHLGEHICVKIADSWKQPSKDSMSSREENSVESTEEEISLLRLNDDCLLHIFSFLPVKEQLKLSLMCERFRNIFEIIFRTKKYLNVGAPPSLTLMETRQILSQVGHHIHEMHLAYEAQVMRNYSSYLKLMFYYCSNIRLLFLEGIGISDENIIHRISNNYRCLKRLELPGSNFKDPTLKFLSELPELEYLDLSHNDRITGKYLCELPKLIELNLGVCSQIHPEHFSKICEVGKLKYLNINGCNLLNKQNFLDITEFLQNLEELVISSSYSTDDIQIISELKKLKILTVCCSSPLREEFLKNLARKTENSLETLVLIDSELTKLEKAHILSMKNLKHLDILGDPHLDDEFLKQIGKSPKLTSLNLAGCEMISNAGLVTIFKEGNNKLKRIDVSNCCLIDEEAVFEIIKYIKNSNRNLHCTLYVGSTNISPDILKHPEYTPYASILTLSFKFPL